jgi:hypothetical protein
MSNVNCQLSLLERFHFAEKNKPPAAPHKNGVLRVDKSLSAGLSLRSSSGQLELHGHAEVLGCRGVG